MAHFSGTIEGRIGKANRGYGTKESGLATYAKAENGTIRVTLAYDEELERDRFLVELITYGADGGVVDIEGLADGTLF